VWGDFYTPYRGIHPKIWLRRNRWLKRYIPTILEFARAAGCERLMIEGPLERPGGAKEKDIAIVAKGLMIIGRLCSDFGVEVSYHPFNLGHIISSVDRLGKLCELTDSKYVHLTIDVQKAMQQKIDPAEIIFEYKERINHIHLRDVTRDGEPVEIGEGIADLVGIYNSLKTIGYKDWIIIQQGVPALERGHRTPHQSVEKAWKYICDNFLNQPASTVSRETAKI